MKKIYFLDDEQFSTLVAYKRFLKVLKRQIEKIEKQKNEQRSNNNTIVS